MLDKFLDIVSRLSDVRKEQLKPESRFVEDLGFDSLDNVELIMEAEEEFGITIQDDEMCSTIGDACALIERKLKE